MQRLCSCARCLLETDDDVLTTAEVCEVASVAIEALTLMLIDILELGLLCKPWRSFWDTAARYEASIDNTWK